MSSQETTPRDGAEDTWWHSVYQGPRSTAPDTPLARTGQGSVDEWFDSVQGVIGDSDSGSGVVPPPGDAGVSTVDEWFDSAQGVIGDPGSGVVSPPADAGERGMSTVDEWFDSAQGAMGGPGAAVVPPPVESTPVRDPRDNAATPAAEPAEPAEPAADPRRRPPTVPDPRSAGAPTDRPRGSDGEAPAEPTAATGQPQGVKAPPPAPQPAPAPPLPHIGDRPPTYDPEPSALPLADPDLLAELVPDTAVEGARYGTLTLRAASVRGDSARYRGEPRRDALLVARFGEPPDGILVTVVAGAARSAEAPPLAAAEACRQLAAAVGRSRAELVADLRSGARDGLRFGLQRMAARAAQYLRDPQDPRDPQEPAAGSLHCVLSPLDPSAGDRVCFGIGPGGLFLLRSAHWIDAYGARLLHHPGEQQPAADPPSDQAFRFRLVPASPGDVLLLATAGFADPVREEPAVAGFLAAHWSHPHPPGTVDFLRQLQVRAKGYADDRTAVALWSG
ncbi:protein phosphatase 2C domain-containing protein [Peterkaempfera bronchialis]|uniref:protein phosphatase 2C domain-containing protein n=1 Tax=Peterkaempfera bronchialis TaxID=2126346 RepID=UPI003C2B85D7